MTSIYIYILPITYVFAIAICGQICVFWGAYLWHRSRILLVVDYRFPGRLVCIAGLGCRLRANTWKNTYSTRKLNINDPNKWPISYVLKYAILYIEYSILYVKYSILYSIYTILSFLYS